ncbi:Pkinase-fungal domain-containing protein [Favolaschia claudopus]|uniref:Pkinase-fungal domain-containing protein n=1 Tax=Favolaschia claudopus TaxID=2862362 RepID=A0AAW0D5M2_9AGAR
MDTSSPPPLSESRRALGASTPPPPATPGASRSASNDPKTPRRGGNLPSRNFSDAFVTPSAVGSLGSNVLHKTPLDINLPKSVPSGTPRAAKGGPSGRAINNTHEGRKQDAPLAHMMWEESADKGFKGIVPIETLFTKYLPSAVDDSLTVLDIQQSTEELVLTARESLSAAHNENATSPAMIDYLEKLLAQFPASNKPGVVDTHSTVIPSLDEGEHDTMPDAMLGRPGVIATKIKEWLDAGLVIEFKFKRDIFKGDKINPAIQSQEALVQVTKNARSLLTAHGACHVYVVTVFQCSQARIFRFDRAGFIATEAFDWLEHTDVLPRFLYRMYNTYPGHMVGDDDTISIPTAQEKKNMYDAICEIPFYNEKYQDVAAATKDSLWIKARVFRVVNGERVDKVVRCFTFGESPLITDSLFGRATRVYRVVLEDDRYESPPTVFALKDSWRQACRRPEVDFYDVIAKHCEVNAIDMAGMARCHGSVDLADTSPDWKSLLHVTMDPEEAGLERRHTRTLLTPFGEPLRNFTSTKALVRALRSAVYHLQIASDAGVLHRDVSEGNILFPETVADDGFLVDWDYAGFTEYGFQQLQAHFPDRVNNESMKDIKRSLKDFTGTFPFIAIKLLNMQAKAAASTIRGGDSPEIQHMWYHDLESVYWLLVWMMLRHTEHSHFRGILACHDLFDTQDGKAKFNWISEAQEPGINGPLYELLEQLRDMVVLQNQLQRRNQKARIEPMTYTAVLQAFDECLALPNWPDGDKAIGFNPPKLRPDRNNQSPAPPAVSQAGNSRVTRASAAKRGSHAAGLDEVALASGSSTAVSDAAPDSREIKKHKANDGTVTRGRK